MAEKNGIVGAVLVVGGGIGGIQASLDLAETGFFVYLVEKSPSIGGVMSQLDKTFPTNDCSMCILSPKLVECGKHLNIKLMPYSEVLDVSGEAGDFRVKVRRKARYIDVDRCTGCGLCAKYCPVRAVDAFNRGLNRRSAAYIDYPQAVPLAYVIDEDKCIGCGMCSRVCLADAIRYEDVPSEEELEVGAVVLAPGFEVFEARLKGEYGYGIYPNVITSIEFERILSASGPFMGHLQRPHDKKEPKKIAFIQCVGSRDPARGINYCSSACCMYATKEAIIAKEHLPSVEPTIFYMDIRAFGKDFDKYYRRAQERYGVRYIRSMISSVKELPPDGDLLLRWTDEEGRVLEEIFDLVILSVGFRTPESLKDLCRRIGVELNEHGFCRTDPLDPVATSRPGIFACGVFAGPKDIPETVTQASGIAARVSELLSPARGTMVRKKELPPEKDIRGEPERIGVFICHCGINIAGVVKVSEVVDYARSLPKVVYATDALYACSQDFQERMKEIIKEHQLNRVVVASCSPRTHEPLFQETLREAGLNPYLFEMANIRDQNSWVHMQLPVEATEKAKDLVRMAVYKARGLEPLVTAKLGVTKSALVIGGGMAGMAAALSLAFQGFPVAIVEKEKELGGNARHLHYILESDRLQEKLAEVITRVRNHPHISVYTGSEVENVQGFVGNFVSTISSPQGKVEIKHGVIIVATGAKELETDEYLRGSDPRVITQRELEAKIASGALGSGGRPERVVMIQCVGSRNDERPYCSRYCCGQAVKNAIRIKELFPDTNIYILYRDIRTYGLKEEYYHKARSLGVNFINYNEDRPPVVLNPMGNLRVTVFDESLKREFSIPADLVVLSVATVPDRENNERLAKMLKVPLNDDGFFLEAHMKLRPVDFATEGIFMCGLAHGPKYLEESIAQAWAAAARAATVLTKDELEAEGKVAFVHRERCTGCGLCEANCPFEAIRVNPDTMVAEVNEVLCKGCGVCSASCRSNAVDVKGFSNSQMLAILEGFVYR